MKKKRKYAYFKKCLIMCILQTCIFSFYGFLFFISFSDAKVLKYVLECFFTGYFTANYFCDVVNTFT